MAVTSAPTHATCPEHPPKRAQLLPVPRAMCGTARTASRYEAAGAAGSSGAVSANDRTCSHQGHAARIEETQAKQLSCSHSANTMAGSTASVAISSGRQGRDRWPPRWVADPVVRLTVCSLTCYSVAVCCRVRTGMRQQHTPGVLAHPTRGIAHLPVQRAIVHYTPTMQFESAAACVCGSNNPNIRTFWFSASGSASAALSSRPSEHIGQEIPPLLPLL